MQLSNKVAIVTGGAKGIGRSTVLKLASEGCDVGIVDISAKEAEEVARQVAELGRRALVLMCDNSDSAAVSAAVEKVVTEFGRIDILVNCAGGITVGVDTTPAADLTSAQSAQVERAPSVATISDAEWQRVLSVNLTGSFLFCRAVVPHMKKQRYGKIVNVSSIGAVYPPGALAHYHASKAGVIGLTNDMSCELAPFGITVNACMPGPILTPFYDKILAEKTEAEKEAFFQILGKETPMQRIGHPDEVANVIYFLSSDLSSFVTGANIPVGGGLPFKANEASAILAQRDK